MKMRGPENNPMGRRIRRKSGYLKIRVSVIEFLRGIRYHIIIILEPDIELLTQSGTGGACSTLKKKKIKINLQKKKKIQRLLLTRTNGLIQKFKM
jgi:hypothetical protein